MVIHAKNVAQTESIYEAETITYSPTDSDTANRVQSVANIGKQKRPPGQEKHDREGSEEIHEDLSQIR